MSSVREEISFEGKRIRYKSDLSMDQVLGNLSKKIGKTVPPEQLGKFGRTREEFESQVKATVGTSGFLSVTKIEYADFLRQYGISRRVVRWMIGNPVMAITMIKPDHSSSLFVPVEFLVMEEDGQKSSVTYVLPSSLIAIHKNEELLAAAKKLDSKLEELIASSIR